MLRPGSLPWLLRHDLRLTFRTQQTGPWAIAFIIVAYLLFTLAGIVTAMGLGKIAVPPDKVYAALGGMALFSLFISFAAAMQLMINALYTRGDYELLLSAPIKPRTILPARLASVWVAVSVSMLAFTSPFMNGGALLISIKWLIGYLTLPLLALVSLSIAFLVLVGLIRLLGAARARTIAQVCSGIIGIGSAIIINLPQMMGRGQEGSGGAFMGMTRLADTPLSSVAQMMGMAVAGQPMALAVLALVAIGGFTLIISLLSPYFLTLATSTLTAAAGPARKRRRRTGATILQPRGPILGLAMRELRLILRDPNLLTQVMSIMLLCLPVVLPTMQKEMVAGDGTIFAIRWLGLLPGLGLLAGAMTWLAVAAEDAPGLLGTAPVRPRDILLGQIVAAGLPSCVLLTVLSVYIGITSPYPAVMMWLCGLLSILCFILLDMRQAPSSAGRSGFQKRYQGAYLLLFLEMMLGFALFGLSVLLIWGSPVWTVPLLLGLLTGAAALLLAQKPMVLRRG